MTTLLLDDQETIAGDPRPGPAVADVVQDLQDPQDLTEASPVPSGEPGGGNAARTGD